MSTVRTVPSPLGNIIKFNKNANLSGAGAAGLEVEATTSADIMKALESDLAFPDREITLGNISVHAEAGKDIAFGEGSGKVSFSGSASAFSGMGVYLDPDKLLADLGLNSNIAPGMKLEQDPNSRYILLRWGYDANAAVQGSLALMGPAGSVKFGVAGASEGLFGVVHRIAKNAGALTAITQTVGSWMLPRQVSTFNDLAPGTWIITEVDGSVALSLGAQYGYDFNWVREAQIGGLTGDIGLRIQLGVAATLGFQASGKYAVVVGRESLDRNAQCLRLRLFKLTTNGWDFAFNAGGTVEAGPTTIFPNKVDDLIKGVFGVHGAQIVKDMQAIEKWTDPTTSLPDALAGLASEYVQKFLTDITEIDAKAEFEKSRKLAEDQENLDPIREVAGLIAKADQQSLQGLLDKALRDVDFLRTSQGKYLESLAVKDLLGAVGNTEAFQALKKAADATIRLLDKGSIEGVLTHLKDFIAKNLNLQPILDGLQKTDFDKLDPWLQKKLSDFLGHTINFDELEKVRKTMRLLLEKRQAFHDKALKALKRKYDFEFAAAYQRTNTSTALLDIDFDFARDALNVRKALESGLNGRFDEVFAQPVVGVELNTATLTHGIKRQSHVELSLPFFKDTVDHMNDSLANANAVDEQDGRLLVYNLNAQDTVSERTIFFGKNERNSRLAVAGNIAVGANNQVRQHSTESLTYSYTFRQAKEKMQRGSLQNQLKPYVDTYFRSSFASGFGGPPKASFDTWITDLDRTIEEKAHNGSNNFGNTLISLEVSLAGSVAGAWLKAPEDDEDEAYKDMSRRLQFHLKRLIPFCYFQDIHHYVGAPFPTAALLVWASLPPSTQIRLQDGRLTPNTGQGLFWDFQDPDKREAMVGHPLTTDTLARELQRIHDLLDSLGMTKDAGFYEAGQLQHIVGDALGRGDQALTDLLRLEAEVIDGAHNAAKKMVEFRKQAGAEPSKAIAALEEFGAKLTDTFNKKISSLYGGDALRPLGSMVFIEAARALDPGLGSVGPNAVLGLTVLRDGVQFPPAGFPNHQIPQNEDVVIEQRLVGFQPAIA